MNLINDPWIPVLTSDGERRTIRPDQIAEPHIASFDWERPDFNIACCELLVGLVYLAAPPANTREWRKGRHPDQVALKDRFAQLASAFELNGPEVRFLQDQEDLSAESNPVDMLLIDSAGASTAKKGADLFVKRARYESLSLPDAAIALYTFQSQAPAGGAGNRTSMRGGGPLITMIEPVSESNTPLWEMIWANVPDGKPVSSENLTRALPWLRPTVTSESGETVHPESVNPVPHETFFGMPRRLRLDFSDGDDPKVIGVRQRPRGTNYGLWQHPLSPYYQQKTGAELLPMHPRVGANTYRNWEGVSLGRSDGLRHVAGCVTLWNKRSGELANLIVAGWAMDNMTPQDILFSRQPLFPLSSESEDFAVAMVDAANAFALALSGAMKTLMNTSDMSASLVEACREDFYIRTHQHFEDHLLRLSKHQEMEQIAKSWCRVMQKVALSIFELHALSGLHRRSIEDIEKIVQVHGRLRAAFSGYGPKTGRKAFEALSLPLPKRLKEKDKAA